MAGGSPHPVVQLRTFLALQWREAGLGALSFDLCPGGWFEVLYSGDAGQQPEAVPPGSYAVTGERQT